MLDLTSLRAECERKIPKRRYTQCVECGKTCRSVKGDRMYCCARHRKRAAERRRRERARNILHALRAA